LTLRGPTGIMQTVLRHPIIRCEAVMKCDFTMDMNAPMEKVFELIHDPEKHTLWLDGVEETRYLEGFYDPAHPVGGKFKQKIREGGRVKEYDGEVTAFTRPKHLGIRLFSKQFSVQVDYHLSPIAAGTRLDYSADVTCNSWIIRVIGALFRPFMRRMVRKQISKLKELAENPAGT
jgi:carbon monoxide dehydrogenase subunit G